MKTDKKYLKHTWVDPRLSVQPSEIHDKGIFATKSIKKGEVVMIWGGEVVRKSTFDETKYRIQSVIPIDDDLYLALPITDKSESIDEYLNHSCDPSSWLIDEVTVVARRDIKKGEEITLDSATWDSDGEWEYAEDGRCSCGTKICRKILTHHDWKRKELHIIYKNHFSPYLWRKINYEKIY